MSSAACTTKSSDEIFHPFYWRCNPTNINVFPEELHIPTLMEKTQNVFITAMQYAIHSTCFIGNIFLGYMHAKNIDAELKKEALNTQHIDYLCKKVQSLTKLLGIDALEFIGILKGIAVGILGMYQDRPIGTSIAMGLGGMPAFTDSTIVKWLLSKSPLFNKPFCFIEWLLGAPSFNKPFSFGFVYAVEGPHGVISAILITPPLKERDTTESLTGKVTKELFGYENIVTTFQKNKGILSVIDPKFLFKYGNIESEIVKRWREELILEQNNHLTSSRSSESTDSYGSPPRVNLKNIHLQFIQKSNLPFIAFTWIIHEITRNAEGENTVLPNICTNPLENYTISTKQLGYFPITYDINYMNFSSSRTFSKFSNHSQNCCETLSPGFPCCPPANIIEQSLLGLLTFTTAIIIGNKYSKMLTNDNGILAGATMGLVGALTNHQFAGIAGLWLADKKYVFQYGLIGASAGIKGILTFQMLNLIQPEIHYDTLPFTQNLLNHITPEGLALLDSQPLEERLEAINLDLLKLSPQWGSIQESLGLIPESP